MSGTGRYECWSCDGEGQKERAGDRVTSCVACGGSGQITESKIRQMWRDWKADGPPTGGRALTDGGTPESSIDHPLEPEVVVEYDHPDDEHGICEGEVWDAWGSDPLVYEILDLDEFVRVRVSADDIRSVVHDPADDLRGDGDSGVRESKLSSHMVLPSEPYQDVSDSVGDDS